MENKKTVDADAALCPIRLILDRFGDKWSMLALMYLGEAGVLRFNELARKIGGVSQRMLTVTLRTLEHDGLVRRQIYAEVPPRVEYTLTDLGQSLLPHLRELTAWANSHMAQILKHRARQPD